jgi:hypothetical protein
MLLALALALDNLRAGRAALTCSPVDFSPRRLHGILRARRHFSPGGAQLGS